MNERDLFRAIGDVSDDLIQEASRPPRKNHWRIYLSTAAAACFCIAALFLAPRIFPGASTDNAAGSAKNQQMECDAEFFGPLQTPEAAEGANPETPGRTPLDISMPTGTGLLEPIETEMTYSYALFPEDFSFVLTWEDQEYDSSTQTLSSTSGESRRVTLTQQEMEHAWMLLSAMEIPETTQSADIALRFTHNGETFHLQTSQDSAGAVSSICAELIRIVETAAQSDG